MTCATTADCSRNGVCVSSRCLCEQSWRGADCGQLAFANSSARAAFNSSLWTWGGSVALDGEGLVHMYASELTNDCGILHYCSNSRIIHLTSTSPLGPYERRDVALEPRSPPSWDSGAVHGPTIRRVGRGLWALYYMGTANTWSPNCGRHPNCTVTVDPNAGDRATRRIGLATAPSPHGPWQRRDAPLFGPGDRAAGDWDWLDVSNPTPIVLSNGSTLLLYKGRGAVQAMGAAIAPRFDGPFTRASPARYVLGPAWEDTYGWVQPPTASEPEVVHVLAHVGNGATSAGGHAWSLDGVVWRTATSPAYTGKVAWADGTTSVLARRERPQLLMVHGGEDARPRPAVLCTSAQAMQRGCADGGRDVPTECRSFTMCERVVSGGDTGDADP